MQPIKISDLTTAGALDIQNDWVPIVDVSQTALASSGQTRKVSIGDLAESIGVVNVKNYGAVGDGVTDDAAAFNAALLAGKRVFVPAGNYVWASTVSAQQDGNVLYGDGFETSINYSGTGTAFDFNGKQGVTVSDLELTSTTGAIGLDVGTVAHNFRIHRIRVDGQSGAVPTGFTTAAIQVERSFYGEISHCDLIYSTRGIYGFNECNGNTFLNNSIRQCLRGIHLIDTTATCNGNSVIGGNIESAAVGTLYGIAIEGAGSTMVQGTRLELTVGTSHVYVNSNVGVAQFNQFLGVCQEGSIAAYVLGDASGSSQVVETTILGGRSAGNITINTDCDATQIVAAPASYGGTLTDNGSGSIVMIDAVNSKHYIKQGTTKKFDLVTGGAATNIDTAGNYLDIKGTVGVHTRFETSGLLRVAQGSLAAGADSGGTASCNTLSSVSDLTANSSGVGTILFKGTTSRNSAGFLKFYIGTTAYYVPVFSAITG